MFQEMVLDLKQVYMLDLDQTDSVTIGYTG